MTYVKRHPSWRKDIISRKIHMYSIDSIILENSIERTGFGIKWESGKFVFPDSNAAQIKKLEAVCIIDRWEF